MADKIPEHLLKQGYLVNMDAPAMLVSHAELEPTGENAYRRWCPKCKQGRLMVTRDLQTMQLLAHDRCTRCAQLVIYTDEKVNGGRLQRVVLLGPLPRPEA